jgi:hypothetical protein
MPTTADGLRYPDDTSNFDLTTQLQNLATDIQNVFSYAETWVGWTPTFSTTINSGFVDTGTGGHAWGHFRQSRGGAGSLIYAEFNIYLGTGFTAPVSGSSDSIFCLFLPVTAYAWAGQNQNQTLGSWTLRDDSGIYHMSGTLGLFDSSDGGRVHFGDAPDNAGTPRISNRRIDIDDPITWAAQDNLTGHLLYRAA